MSILAHRAGRRVFFTLLYLCEGSPIGFVWWALPTLLRLEGVAIGPITALTASLVLPWTLKFLWAPIVDALRSPRWGYRAWIGSAQLVMGMALVPLIWLDPTSDFGWWRTLLLIHAVAAATQDVAIDALAITVVPPEERGTLNGAMQAGMLFGRSAFGGGALLVLSQVGREWVVGALIALIWSTMLLLPFAVQSGPAAAPGRAAGELMGHLRGAARSRVTWIAIAFALTSAAAFESAGQLAGPYLVDRGLSQRDIGLFFGVGVVIATVTGGLVGGRLSDRWGRRRSVAGFLVAFVVTIAALGIADLSGVTGSAVAVALLIATYLSIGLFTAASYALFMDLTDPTLAGTQFSTYMAATNGCESWSAWAGGRMASAGGYAAAFVGLGVVSLASLILLRWLPNSSTYGDGRKSPSMTQATNSRTACS